MNFYLKRKLVSKMNEIWSPLRLSEYLKNHECLAGSYCTKNFSWAELLVNQSEKPPLAVLENLLKVALLLQKYRNTVFRNSPITITSGWRSQSYNKKVGGYPNSYHLTGMAVDFVVKNYTPPQVQMMLDPVHRGGMEYAPGWTHIDIREIDVRFDSKGRILRKSIRAVP